ncbi:2-phospho-L-lactate transferase like, CofD-like [Desulfocucumis palustris]|uniref:Putative gluconeogenesis factor n=1 Tax=Desulfocucumis palustris TaxID=1898651 RepID=A0A2L2XHR2_9FIRM|nr:gluconeogenesis factor YvcK family protein [Desulfocucumis palustris]GBF35524.1 2-phospho-L-lactate transferase like, CofD-like [Desulfocucumis palustris]
MNLFKWLYPGLHVKRWLFLVLAGTALTLGGTVLLAGLLMPVTRTEIMAGAREILGPLAGWPWVLVFPLTGLAAVLLGLQRTFRSIIAVLAPAGEQRLVDIIYSRRYLRRGPRIVVIGGGSGLSVLLRGIKDYTSNITAIVSVADDGGSSGRLRGDLGILPPGDIRNCMVALADKESLMEALLQYRFTTGELKGHNLGNLLLAALNEVAGGFHQGVQGMSRVLAIRGRVLPATLEDVRLGAEFSDGAVVWGESSIPGYGRRIERVFLDPADCYPLPEALKAIHEADAVILGPGSLYTSIIPNLMVRGMADALARTRAIKIYVCNIMTQPGETDGYTASEHLGAIVAHSGEVVDYMAVNTEEIPAFLKNRYSKEGAVKVRVDPREIEKLGAKAVTGEFLAGGDMARHNPKKLAETIINLTLANKKPLERMSLLHGMGNGQAD